jgi:hypothetical protein
MITPSLENRQVEEGNEVIFDVEVTGTPAPIVKWYREGAEIMENADFVVSNNGSRLTIVKTYGEDTGNFTVSAVNVAGKATSTCHLAVLETNSLKNVSRAPVSRGPAPSTMPKPANVNLRQYESSVDSRELTVTKTDQSMLAFKSFKSVKAPATKEKINADHDAVLPPWKMESVSKSVRQTTIVQESSSYSKTQVTATSHHVAASESGHSDKSGSEVSYTRNESAEPGMMAPVFTKALDAVSTPEGNSTIFIAFVEAFPAPEVKFYREGAFIEHNEDFIQSFDKNTGCCKLLIKETFIDDAGRYTLTCHNDAGTASCSAQLSVTQSVHGSTGRERIRSPIEGGSADELSLTDHDLSGFETNDMVEVNDYISGNETEEQKEDQYYAQTALSPVDEERTEDKSISEQNPIDQLMTNQALSVPPQLSPTKESRAPGILTPLAQFTKLVEGDSFSFSVSVDPSSEAHVYWMKDGRPLMGGYRLKMDDDKKLGLYKLTLCLSFFLYCTFTFKFTLSFTLSFCFSFTLPR